MQVLAEVKGTSVCGPPDTGCARPALDRPESVLLGLHHSLSSQYRGSSLNTLSGRKKTKNCTKGMARIKEEGREASNQHRMAREWTGKL